MSVDNVDNEVQISHPKRQRDDFDACEEVCDGQTVVKRRRLDAEVDVVETTETKSQDVETPDPCSHSDSTSDSSDSDSSTSTVTLSPAKIEKPFDATAEITRTLQFVCFVTLFTFLMAAIGVIMCPAAPHAYLEYMSDAEFYDLSPNIRPRVFGTVRCLLHDSTDNTEAFDRSIVQTQPRFVPNAFYYADPMFV